jgi:hypothetical protein
MKVIYPILWALLVIGGIEVSNAATTRFDSVIANGTMSIGDTAAANSKAVIDIKSTTKGMLPPRMTTAQRDAISSPPTGLTVFNTTTNKLNIYNGTAWGEAGGGVGGINYIQQTAPGNYDAESNSTTGWATYDDAAATPVDGTGGTFGGTFAATPSPALRGTYSFKYTPGTAGEGASYDFTIDPADKGQPLQITLDYSLSATITEGDYQIWIYDVTNGGSPIQPSGYKLSGTSGTNYKTQPIEFQAASNSTSYRLLVHQAGTTSAELIFDSVAVGPQNIARGPPVVDPIAYTPTLTASAGTPDIGNGTLTGFYAREGKYLVGTIKFVAGSTTTFGTAGASLRFSLPPGLSVDESAINLSSSLYQNHVGDGGILDSGTASYPVGVAYATGANTYVNLLIYDAGSSVVGDNNTVNNNAPFTWTTSDAAYFNFKVPIVSWSSSMLMSSDASTSVVAFSGQKSAAQSGISGSTRLTYGTVSVEKGLSYASATGLVTVQVPGTYRVYGSLQFESVASGEYVELTVYKNTSTAQCDALNYATQTTHWLDVDCVRDYVAGDTIEIKSNSNSATYDAASGSRAQFMVTRISGPTQIAASETVAARYYGSATTLTNGGTSDIVYTTKDYDTHGIYNNSTGVITFPRAGKCDISATMATAAFAAGSATRVSNLYVTETTASAIGAFDQHVALTTSAIVHWNAINTTLNVLAGQTAKIQYSHDLGVTPTVSGETAQVVLNVKCSGN